MAFFSRFYPDRYVVSAFKIDYKQMYLNGYRAVIFDIDNTLVRHGYPADVNCVSLFKQLKKIGLSPFLLSNNNEKRIKKFTDIAPAPYIENAHKPSPAAYIEAMERLGTTPAETFFVGDQLFTDIWGAKKSGIYCILTKPIHPREELQIIIKRPFEKIILYYYKKANKKGK